MATVIGVLLLLLSVVGGVAMAWSGFGSASKTLTNHTDVRPDATVSVSAGEERQLFREQTSAEPSCTVTGPDGTPVTVRSQSTGTTVTLDETTWFAFGSWRADESGRYAIACSGGDAMVAPALSGKDIGVGVSGVLLAVFGGLGGAALTLVGIIGWVVGNRRERDAMMR